MIHEPLNITRQSVTVVDDEYAAVSEGRIRIRIGVVIFLVMVCLAIIRLFDLTIVSPSDPAAHLPQSITTTRADITDRNGDILATTLKTYSLYAEPRRIWNIDETVQLLSSVLPELNTEVLRKKLSQNNAFVWVERGLNPRQRQAVFDLGVPGLGFRVEPQRVYPRGSLAAHIVGFSDVDMGGAGGAERAFDAELSAKNAPAKALSIDMRVQYAVADEMARGLKRFEANSVAGIVLNIRSGEILAMASLPNFDPNNPGATLPETRFNHASMSTYELGSVFKPLTMAMVLEDDIVPLDETFPVQNPFKVRHKFIRDDHPSKDPMAMPDILAQSSNRGTAMMAVRLGAERQKDYLHQLGLMDRVPFELAESARPQTQERWIDLTTVTVSYGHGISVTPLALAAAMGAVLNGGDYIAPTVAKRDAANPAAGRKVFSEKTSQILRDLMRYVVTNGTGRNARVRGYGMMGKTGTADKPAIGGYDERRLVSSFIGAFPYDNPTYLVLVTYDEPKAVEGTFGYATAGWNAAPTVGKIVERIAPILGVANATERAAMSPFSAHEALR